MGTPSNYALRLPASLKQGAEQVARETGAAYGGVLYVDSLSLSDGPVPTYLDLLRVTSTTVAEGLTAAGD